MGVEVAKETVAVAKVIVLVLVVWDPARAVVREDVRDPARAVVREDVPAVQTAVVAVEEHVVTIAMVVLVHVQVDVPHAKDALHVQAPAQVTVTNPVQAPAQVTVTNPVQVAALVVVHHHAYQDVPTPVWMPALPVPHVQANVPQLVWVVLMLVKQAVVTHVLPVPMFVASPAVSPATPPVTVTVMESV